MIGLTPGVAPSFADEIAALPRSGCWARLLIEDLGWSEATPDLGWVRLHAYRLAGGGWQIALEEYVAHHLDFPGHFSWIALDRDWDAEGFPAALCSIDAAQATEIPSALDSLIEAARRLWTDSPAVAA